MLQARSSHRVFSRGDITFPRASNRSVLALTREWCGDIALVIHNLSKLPQLTHLDLSRYQSLVPHQLLGMHRFPAITSEPYFIILSPYASLWFLLQQPSRPGEA
jgi:maltose alpha-D-glucosyltransferase/alpha-amylase